MSTPTQLHMLGCSGSYGSCLVGWRGTVGRMLDGRCLPISRFMLNCSDFFYMKRLSIRQRDLHLRLAVVFFVQSDTSALRFSIGRTAGLKGIALFV